MTDWCILRTAGRSTLPLAAQLGGDGFDVWTPIEYRARLAGRDREQVEQSVAILPGYVFASMDRRDDLLNMARSPTMNYRVWDADQRRIVVKGYPHFSVFLAGGKVCAVSENSLSSLRALEAALARVAERRRSKATPSGPPPRFRAGQIVRMVSHGCGGMDLTVVEPNKGKAVKLDHPEWLWPVEISAWKLQAIQIEAGMEAAV